HPWLANAKAKTLFQLSCIIKSNSKNWASILFLYQFHQKWWFIQTSLSIRSVRTKNSMFRGWIHAIRSSTRNFAKRESWSLIYILSFQRTASTKNPGLHTAGPIRIGLAPHVFSLHKSLPKNYRADPG